MAGKGKGKSRTKEQVALYAEIVRLMTTLNQRSAESIALSQKLAEAQGKLPEILRQLQEQAEKAGHGIKNLNKGQREGAAETKTFVQSLMTLELSLRRIQSGFNGIKKTALFAEKTQKDMLQFAQLARSIDASAEAMKALDQAGRKFGLGFGEASGLIKNMKANLADLRWGGSGGGIGQLMSRWGGNFTGYESEKEMLTKLREVYMRVRPEDRIMVSKDIGASDAMQDFLTSDQFKTTADFEKYLDEHQIKSLKDAEAAARKGVAGQGEKANAEENKDISNMVELGGLTNKTNEILTNIYKFMGDNPWITATKMGLDMAGSLGSSAMGAAAIANLFKGAKAAGAVAGAAEATAAAGTAASGGAVAAGAVGLSTLGIIAVALAVIAGGWIAVEKIGGYLQDKKRGKKEGETDAEAEARIKRERQDLADRGATATDLKEFDEQAERDKKAREFNNNMVKRQKEIAERFKKGEFVSDADLQYMSQRTGVTEYDTEIDSLIPTRDADELRKRNQIGMEAAKPNGDFLTAQIAKFEKDNEGDEKGNVRALLDVFRTENHDKLDPTQWKMFANYLQNSTAMWAVNPLRKFAEDPQEGYTIPREVVEALKHAQGTMPDMVGVGEEAIADYSGVFKGQSAAFKRIKEYGDKPIEERQRANNAENLAAFEKLRQERQFLGLERAVGGQENPHAADNTNVIIANGNGMSMNAPVMTMPKQGQQQMPKAPELSADALKLIAPPVPKKPMLGPTVEAEAALLAAQEQMNGAFSKVGEASEIADAAQASGGVVNNNTTTSSQKNEISAPVHNDIHITQNLQRAEDAGKMLDSTVKQVGQWSDPFELNPWLKDFREAGQAFGTAIVK